MNVFNKFEHIDQKLLEHDKDFERVFKALEKYELPEKGIFFDGQVFDAYKFVSGLIKSANKSIILIDNYVDDSTLTLFYKTSVPVTIYTQNITKQLKLDLDKYNSQYGNIVVKEFSLSHDRFLIIDSSVYHFGASLKDLGKKWFGFSKLDEGISKLIINYIENN
jgi:hypothetical protein